MQIINSGAPGSAPNVRIRGIGSVLAGGTDPLYVVDGIITNDIIIAYLIRGVYLCE